jgi:FkbM family methyltransferase
MPASAQQKVRESLDLYWRASFAQYGEDLIAESYLGDVERGFFVDIGAHHPVRFSNTYRFYRRGWSGINVDPIPAAIRNFNARRPRDINVEAGIGAVDGVMRFFMFDEPAVNTFSKDAAQRIAAEGRYKLVDSRDVQVLRLEGLLDQYLAAGQEIHLMSIDVEGLEAEVLGSNNWAKYRPRLILLELNDADVVGALESPVVRDLLDKGYRLFAKSYNTLTLVRAKAPAEA